MEHILISGASHLRLPNQFGIKKILRNILALQQSIKSLTNDRQDSEFEKAKFYYSLFFISPKVFLLLRIHSYAEVHSRKCLTAPEKNTSSPLMNTKPCSTFSAGLIPMTLLPLARPSTVIIVRTSLSYTGWRWTSLILQSEYSYIYYDYARPYILLFRDGGFKPCEIC